MKRSKLPPHLDDWDKLAVGEETLCRLCNKMEKVVEVKLIPKPDRRKELPDLWWYKLTCGHTI